MNDRLTVPRTYEDYRDLFTGYAMPFAFVDLDLLEGNSRHLVERASGMPLRVATKSVRSVGLLRRILDSGPGIRGLMCYSAREAAWLTDQGFDDLLIAYPVVQPEDIRVVCQRVRQGGDITFMVDCEGHLNVLQRCAREEGVRLQVCFDLDVSERLPGLHFGVKRSPLHNAEAAVALYRRLSACPDLSLVGLMAYEAQIAGVPDNLPHQRLRNGVVRRLKAYSAPRVARLRQQTVTALVEAGARLRFVNGGGTGSLETTSKEHSVTEVTAGSGFYCSHLFDNFQAFQHFPAAGFALAVTRIPGPGVYTCAGGGYIASGAPGREKLPRPYLPADACLTATEGAGEVQTPIQTRTRLEIGDPVFFRHSKAGELCEHFNRLWLVRQGEVVDSVSTYRGDGQVF